MKRKKARKGENEKKGWQEERWKKERMKKERKKERKKEKKPRKNERKMIVNVFHFLSVFLKVVVGYEDKKDV